MDILVEKFKELFFNESKSGTSKSTVKDTLMKILKSPPKGLMNPLKSPTGTLNHTGKIGGIEVNPIRIMAGANPSLISGGEVSHRSEILPPINVGESTTPHPPPNKGEKPILTGGNYKNRKSNKRYKKHSLINRSIIKRNKRTKK